MLVIQEAGPDPGLHEKAALAKSPTRAEARKAIAGFSVVELVVSFCVMLILTAIAVPSLMRSLRTYQLNDAASRVASMLKFARFEAVRRNKQINFLLQASGTGWLAGTDSNNNNALDATEKQEYIGGFASMVGAGTPPAPSAITTALGVSSLNTVSGGNSSITFDARGAVRASIGATVSGNVYVFYIGSANDPDPGYRAVILLPSGSTQIWTAPQAGPWQRVG